MYLYEWVDRVKDQVFKFYHLVSLTVKLGSLGLKEIPLPPIPMPFEAYLNRGEESPLISDLYLGGGLAELSLLIRALQCGNGEVIRYRFWQLDEAVV